MIKTWEELKVLSNGQWPDDECMKSEIAALREYITELEAQEPVARFNWDIGKFEWLTTYSYELHHMKPFYLAAGAAPNRLLRINALALSKILHSQPLDVAHATEIADRLVELTNTM